MATLGPLNDFNAGTTIVAADMNQNFTDIETFVNTTPGVVQKDIVDAKGDLIVATSADAVSRLAVGTNDYVLTAASGEATGVKWAAAASDATKMPLAGGTFTGAVSFDDNVIVKGDSTNGSGKLTLNCENNSHGVHIKGPAHSAGATYTLTLPTALPTVTGQSLTSDTSGNLGFTTVDAAFVETPQTISTSKVIGANINAGMIIEK